MLRESVKTYSKRYLCGTVVDLGCGTKQYKSLVEPYVIGHIGIDHKQTLHDKSNIDIFGTLYHIPVKNNSFDSALCTEVLEHLEEPAKFIQECWRILKPNSAAVFTSPFIWHLHEEPRDFFRYTPHGLKHLFESNGFKVIEISPLNGFCATFGQLFVYYIYTFNVGPLKYVPFIPIAGGFIQHFALLMDKITPGNSWPSHYVTVVRRLE